MIGARDGLREGARTERIRVVVGGICILGRRQVTPRWEDNPVRRHVGGGGVGARGGCPPLEGKQESGRVGEEGQVKKYETISNRA